MISKGYSISTVLTFLLMFCASVPEIHAQQMQFADLEYPFEVEYQRVGNGQHVAYIDEGQGLAVILIHGLGSYIPAWKQNLPALSQSHRVVALDLPGFGKSSKEADSYSIPFFAETVAQLQDSLGIDNAIWVGHSMGGQIAMRGALSYPEKISKLVLISPAGFETFTDQEAATMTKYVTPASIKATPDSMIRQTFRTAFYDFPEEAQFMADDRVAIREADGFDGYARGYAKSVQAMLEGPVFDELSNISKPALVLFGKQDALIHNRQLHPGLSTQKVAETGVDKLGNARLKMFDQAGHFVHFERAETVNKEILNFINQ